MVDDSKGWTNVLSSLEEIARRRRYGSRTVGRKAYLLSKMLRADLPVPKAWVIHARYYQAFVDRCLPAKHDLKSLIKLSGTSVGDQRCARAYRELLTQNLDDDLVKAIGALWNEHLQHFSDGVVVRPSLLAGDALVVPHLHSYVERRDLASVVDAVRRLWASSVLSDVVAGYVQAGQKDVSVAVLLQESINTKILGLLTRTTDPSKPIADDEWQLGVLAGHDRRRSWRRRAQLLMPLSIGVGAEQQQPKPLRDLSEHLGPSGFECLREMAKVGDRELGAGAVLYFSVDPESDALHVLGADDSPRWRPLKGGDELTIWTELTLGGPSPQPPTRLTQSVTDRMVRGALVATIDSLGCDVDDAAALVARSDTRSYLNVSALMAAITDMPFFDIEDLLRGVGGISGECARALSTHVHDRGGRSWRAPLIVAKTLREQVRLENDVVRLERGIERDVRSLFDIDLTILPHDGMATTFRSAQALLDRCAELWSKCVAAQFVCRLSMRALVQRRMPDATPMVGFTISSGSGSRFTTAMADSFAYMVDVFRGDPEMVAQLRAQVGSAEAGIRLPTDFPDGPCRGALGQFLGRYGDMAVGVFELSRPRWREDARDLLRMIILAIDAPARAGVPTLQLQARAMADSELARYEPELSPTERALLRRLVDRCKAVGRLRTTVDRLLFRSLRLLRQVIVDIDRRLRRVDSSVPEGGAFFCSSERLLAALHSGRPELLGVIQMRLTERENDSHQLAPPLSFMGSPPRGAIPIIDTPGLEGLGVSTGVVEGRARLIQNAVPNALATGDILVMPALDPALAPLYPIASGVVAEVGGAQSLGAELARDLGMPCVASVPNAGLRIREGEWLRIDGDRGLVKRLDAEPSS